MFYLLVTMTILEQKFNNEMLIQYDQFVKDTFFLCQYVIFIKIMTDFFFHFGGFYSFWKLLTTVSMQSAVILHSFETILQGYLKRRYFSVIWALIFFIFDSSPSFVHTWKQRRTFSKIKSMRLSIMARKSEDIMEKNPNTFKIFIT